MVRKRGKTTSPSTFPRSISLPASQVPTRCHRGKGSRGCVHSGTATLGHSVLLTLFPCSSMHPSMPCSLSKTALLQHGCSGTSGPSGNTHLPWHSVIHGLQCGYLLQQVFPQAAGKHCTVHW